MAINAQLQKFIDDAIALSDTWNITEIVALMSPARSQATIVVHPWANLLFHRTESVSLSATTIIVLPGGTLYMQPASADVKHEIIFRDVPFDETLDPGHWGHGLICLGKCVIAGSPKTSWVRANRTVIAGQRTINADYLLSKWKAGDKLVFSDTRRLGENDRAGNYVPKWEVAEIADDFGLASPLLYDHIGQYATPTGVAYYPHIGNLTRNVVIRSENNHGVRGRMLFLGVNAEVSIRHCEMESLGRAVIGSNNWQEPVKFQGLRKKPVYEDNSNWCSLAPDDCRFKWPLMIHDTHYGSFKRNVIHNWAGAGVVVWSGNEIGNEIESNLVTGIRGYSNPRNNDADDGSAYWSRGWLSTFRNNIAAGAGSYFSGVVAGSGFNLFSTHAETFDTGMVRRSPTELFDVWTTRDMRQTPLRNFEGNEAYGCATGLTIWNLGTDGYRTYPIEQSVVKGLKAWNCWGEGFYAYPIHNVLFDGCEMVNCGDGWHAGDYWMSDCAIRNSKVIACGNVSRGTNINGTFILENCDFQTFNGVAVEPRATPGTGAYCPPLTTRIVNCRHNPMPWRPLKTITTYYNLFNNRTALFQENAIEVVAHNGVVGDDFDVYFLESAGDFVIPDSPNVIYPPANIAVKGLTNQVAWDRHRVSICGVVAPAGTTTRPDVVGLVKLKNVPEPTPNRPPVVEAGPDQTIPWDMRWAVQLAGSVSDEVAGQVLTVGWTQVSGPGAAVFSNTSSPDSRALITSAGEYVLRLLASDGELTASDTVTITVLPEPVPEPVMVSVPAAELMSVRNDLEALLEMMKGWRGA